MFGTPYSYGYGRVGVLQEYLLTQADVDRLIAARDEQDLAKELMTMKISSHVDYSPHPHRFIQAIEKWLQHEVRAMVPENMRAVFDILWMKDDSSLLSYLLKRHHGLTSDLSSEPHVGATAFEPDDLRLAISGGRPTTLPESLLTFIRDVRDRPGLSAQEIDTRVARYVAQRQVELARKSGSRAIQLYVAHHIDLLNIRIARRLPEGESPAAHLLDGGEVDASRFTLDTERLAELVYSSSLPTSLADSIKSAEDSSVALERGLAKAIAHDLARMRNAVLSIDPIFAFNTIALSQLRLLRTILVGKTARLSVDELRDLLPPFLSASPFA